MNELGLVSFFVERSYVSAKILVYSIEWAIVGWCVPVVTALCFTVCFLLALSSQGTKSASSRVFKQSALQRQVAQHQEELWRHTNRSFSLHSLLLTTFVLVGSYLTSLRLGFLIFKLAVTLVPASRGYCVRIQWSAARNGLSTVPGMKHLIKFYAKSRKICQPLLALHNCLWDSLRWQ